MGKNSAIEWTDATLNFWMGCTKVSQGCKNCYMFRDQIRYGHDPTELRRAKDKTFYAPLNWKEPMKIFTCSWSDFFHEDVPNQWLDDAWNVIRKCPQHTFMILTKRPNVAKYSMPEDWGDGWPNVWLGVSVENQDNEWRIVALEEIPAKIKFVSSEPLLGPLSNLYSYFPVIDWVITGGESGYKNPRPCNLDWVREIRDDCQKAGIPFFHKQHGGSKRIDGVWGGRVLNGRTWDEFPNA